VTTLPDIPTEGDYEVSTNKVTLLCHFKPNSHSAESRSDVS
jgi:hypothetical protein